MKLFQNSFLSLPLVLLGKLFPFYKKYTGGNYEQASEITHFWTIPIFSLFFSLLAEHKGNWFLLGIVPVVLMHLVVKELIVDRLKHGKFNWPDVLTRGAGLVVSVPLILIELL